MRTDIQVEPGALLVFLVLLSIAWAILVLPRARAARWMIHPWHSARRYRSSMSLVAPRTESEVRRFRRSVAPSAERPIHRARTRRREVMVFLAAGALSAVVVGALAEKPGAWPVGGVFAGLFILYTAAVVEADRRRTAKRIAARRRAREAEARRYEREYAEAV